MCTNSLDGKIVIEAVLRRTEFCSCSLIHCIGQTEGGVFP